MRGALRNVRPRGRWIAFSVLGALALTLLVISIVDLTQGGDSGTVARCVSLVCTLLLIAYAVRNARRDGDM